MRHSKLLLACVLGSTLLAMPALADIPPADACTAAQAGEHCNNAGENADALGVCSQSTCSRATPDGPLAYECYTCVRKDNVVKDEADDDDSSCAVSAVPIGGFASVVAPLAAFVLAVARRRARS